MPRKKSTKRKTKKPVPQHKKITHFFYRRRITVASLVLAAFITLIPLCQGDPLICLPFYGIALWFCLSMIGECIVYGIMGKRDSQKVDPKALKKDQKIKPHELDAFFMRMANIKAFVVTMAGLAFFLYFIEHKDVWISVYIFLMTYFFVGLFSYKIFFPKKYPLNFIFIPQERGGFHKSSTSHKSYTGSTSSSYLSSSSSSSYSSTGSYYSYSNSPGRDQLWKS